MKINHYKKTDNVPAVSQERNFTIPIWRLQFGDPNESINFGDPKFTIPISSLFLKHAFKNFFFFFPNKNILQKENP